MEKNRLKWRKVIKHNSLKTIVGNTVANSLRMHKLKDRKSKNLQKIKHKSLQINKYIVKLVTISIKTNKKCVFWQKIFKKLLLEVKS